jgi:hypothetical protein
VLLVSLKHDSLYCKNGCYGPNDHQHLNQDELLVFLSWRFYATSWIKKLGAQSNILVAISPNMKTKHINSGARGAAVCEYGAAAITPP